MPNYASIVRITYIYIRVCGSINVLQIYIFCLDSKKILRLLSNISIALALPNYKLASFPFCRPSSTLLAVCVCGTDYTFDSFQGMRIIINNNIYKCSIDHCSNSRYS